MQIREHATHTGPWSTQTNRVDCPVPRELHRRVHWDTWEEPIEARAVLVVGWDEGASRVVRRLCRENEVTLACERPDLRGMRRNPRFVLRELAFEDEIHLWRSAHLERLEVAQDGRCRAVFSAGGPAPADFDEVVFCTAPATLHSRERPGCAVTLPPRAPRRAG